MEAIAYFVTGGLFVWVYCFLIILIAVGSWLWLIWHGGRKLKYTIQIETNELQKYEGEAGFADGYEEFNNRMLEKRARPKAS